MKEGIRKARYDKNDPVGIYSGRVALYRGLSDSPFGETVWG